ncbi:MAG: ribosome recycling factor [Moraxellaceae bacterium]|nr:MAG: ribosome recycling factor [Moraxellaceae bacterium]
MINDLKKDGESRMKKSIESLEAGFAKVRTGRAHPSMLNNIMVSYYGSDVPLNQVASVGLDDARTLVEHSNTDYEQQPHKQQRVKARALVSAPAAWKERFGNYHSLMWTFADRPDSE